MVMGIWRCGKGGRASRRWPHRDRAADKREAVAVDACECGGEQSEGDVGDGVAESWVAD